MVYLVVYHINRKTTTQGMLLNIVSVERINIMLPPFALLHNDSNQNSRRNVSKISVNQAVRWLQISLATKQAKFKASEMLDWRNFWKHFHMSFALNHRVAMQTVVTFAFMTLKTLNIILTQQLRKNITCGHWINRWHCQWNRLLQKQTACK